MGSGDWNDGMNLVGDRGQGESVWLAFFLCDVLTRFVDVARLRKDHAFADLCVAEAERLRQNIEQHGWDGAWYRRAYFDDGTPLGSASNAECQIDSLPQSWAVLSGAGGAERSRQALAALDARLVRPKLGLIQLLDPPFDTSNMKPGYLKGYVPGVRENGGQYTHAAVWAVMAFAAAGQGERAWELFNLINPIRHGDSAEAIATYQVEPYVVAADVYTNPQHAGRGGWTWYTGSASWMYRLITESLLGLRLEADRLWINPILPAAWKGFTIHYRYRETMYHLRVRQGVAGAAGDRSVARVSCDGVPQADRSLLLRNDGVEHEVEIDVGGGTVSAPVTLGFLDLCGRDFSHGSDSRGGPESVHVARDDPRGRRKVTVATDYGLRISAQLEGRIRRCAPAPRCARRRSRKQLGEIAAAAGIRGPRLKPPAQKEAPLRFYVYEGYRIAYQLDSAARRVIVLGIELLPVD